MQKEKASHLTDYSESEMITPSKLQTYPIQLKQFNDLRNLLSTKQDTKFDEDLNLINQTKQKIIHSLKKQTWLEKLNLEQNNQNSSAIEKRQIYTHRRNNKTTQLIPLQASHMEKGTSRNISGLDSEQTPKNKMKLRLKTIDRTPTNFISDISNGINKTFDLSLQDKTQRRTNDFNTTSLNTRKVSTTDTSLKGKWPFYQSVINSSGVFNGSPHVKEGMITLQTIMDSQVQDFKINLRGKNMELLYQNKEQNLLSLKEENQELKIENQQIKQLNTRLMERLDYLQNIIDKEASAKEFYFNYPPKPDSQLKIDNENIISGKNQKSPRQILKEFSKAEEQIRMVRKVFEERIEKDTRIHQREFNQMQRSFTIEVDELQTILSSTIQDQVKLYNEHCDLTQRFNAYYTQCDNYIKNREEKILKLKSQNQAYKKDLDRISQLYNREKLQHEALQRTHTAFMEQYNKMKDENVLLRKEVLMYEEKYKFIDISKMHEKIQLLSTQLDQSEKKRKTVQQELFDLREKILRATSKKYSVSQLRGDMNYGPNKDIPKPSFASVYLSPGKKHEHQQHMVSANQLHNPMQTAESRIQSPHQKSESLQLPSDFQFQPQPHSLIMPQQTWEAEQEVEETASALLDFIHNELAASLPKGKEFNQWNHKVVNSRTGPLQPLAEEEMV